MFDNLPFGLGGDRSSKDVPDGAPEGVQQPASPQPDLQSDRPGQEGSEVGSDKRDAVEQNDTAGQNNTAGQKGAAGPAQMINPIIRGLRDFIGQLSTPPARRVELARATERPNADYYIDALFHDFVEMHGDRLDSDDQSIKGGVAYFHDLPVTVIAQCKGKTLEDNIRYNFGMPNPQGYRKAQRLARQAEKFGRPIITIIDTPGAYPGIEAEAKGQGEAIARSIELFSTLKVPVIALFVGEGGSGGALALGVANSVIMLENAIYSILSPEGFASILWKDSSRSREAASLMRLTSYDIMQFEIADAIIYEGADPIKAPCPELVSKINSVLVDEIVRLAVKEPAELVEDRYQKFRSIGKYMEAKEERS